VTRRRSSDRQLADQRRDHRRDQRPDQRRDGVVPPALSDEAVGGACPVGQTGPMSDAPSREASDETPRAKPRRPAGGGWAAAAGDGPLLDLGEALGGRRGIVDASLPGFVLVVVNVAVSLGWAIVAAVATAVVIGALRIVRKEPLRQAVSGVLGIAFAALLAAYTGQAKNFFLPGIIINAAYAVALLASIAARRPVLGYVAAALDRRFVGWRADPALVRRATGATLVWIAVFVTRFVLQGWLYLHDHVGWLATARLAMGWPMWGLAVMASLLLLQPPASDDAPDERGARTAA
jgi:Protein of unknown function (DUF3159)